jgi:hypothetical protein
MLNYLKRKKTLMGKCYEVESPALTALMILPRKSVSLGLRALAPLLISSCPAVLSSSVRS